MQWKAKENILRVHKKPVRIVNRQVHFHSDEAI